MSASTTGAAAPAESTVERPGTPPNWTARAAAAGAVLAGGLHLLASVVHSHHGSLVGVFFLAVGGAQIWFGLAARRGTTGRTATAGIAATVGLVVLYLVSRTVTLPIGAHADRPEDGDLLGLAVLAAELATIVALSALLDPRWRARVLNGVLAAGAGVWTLWATGLLG